MIYYNGKFFESKNSLCDFLFACPISPLSVFFLINYFSDEDSERCIDLALLAEI